MDILEQGLKLFLRFRTGGLCMEAGSTREEGIRRPGRVSARVDQPSTCSTLRGAMKYSQVRAMKYMAGIMVKSTA
ncbi:hypothetical protein D3C78_269770 [compost metagenome]